MVVRATSTPPTSATHCSHRSSIATRKGRTSAHSSTLYNPIAHVAREPQGEGEVIDLPALSRENDAESSGGETRTLNLAVRSLVVA